MFNLLKFKNRITTAAAIMVTAVGMVGCESYKNAVVQPTPQNHQVSLNYAKIIAQNENLPAIIGLGQSKPKGVKVPTRIRLIDKTIVMSEQEDTLLYVFTYKNGGFCVISADDRHKPILAYSEDSQFDMQKPNAGIATWFDVQSKGILALKQGKITPKPENQLLWQRVYYTSGLPTTQATCVGQPIAIESIGVNSTLVSVTTVGPLLQTTWGQGCGYNDLVSTVCAGNCTPTLQNRAVTGCVATSMAQVMRKWNKPTSYIWNNMPNNSGNIETAKVMRDAGTHTSMNYGCSGSATTHDKAANALRNNFGYTTASRQDYNYATVFSNLGYGQPVILGGCNTRNSFLGITTGYEECHSWVCDGYMQSVYCEYTMLLFHMNWGWDGSFNGWYSFDNWNIPNAGYNFQYAKDMIINIR